MCYDPRAIVSDVVAELVPIPSSALLSSQDNVELEAIELVPFQKATLPELPVPVTVPAFETAVSTYCFILCCVANAVALLLDMLS